MRLLKIDKLLIAWSLVVLVAISMPVPPSSPVSQVMSIFDYFDKIAHVILFGMFAFLSAESLFGRNKKILAVYTISFLLACCYAALSELIQVFIPTRSASVADFIAGAMGAAMALLIFYVRNQRKR